MEFCLRKVNTILQMLSFWQQPTKNLKAKLYFSSLSVLSNFRLKTLLCLQRAGNATRMEAMEGKTSGKFGSWNSLPEAWIQ